MQISKLALSAATLGVSTNVVFAQPDTWALLKDIQINEIVTETSYEVRKTWPKGFAEEEVEIEITGYAAPLTPEGEALRELILVSDMGLCPFCGNPDHNAGLQVQLAEALPFVSENQRITLRGTLSKVHDPETWQAAILRDARIVP